MDRDAIAREGRRAQALEALAFEQAREALLREQIAAVVLEEEGDRLDQEIFARLPPDDVQRVRDALGQVEEDAVDDPFVEDQDGLYVTFADEQDESQDAGEDEIARLEHEIGQSQASQLALERYLGALTGDTTSRADGD